MITILVELGARMLGGSLWLLPFDVLWLGSNTCRKLLNHVLVEHLERHTALAIAEVVKIFCTKQEVVTEYDITVRIERDQLQDYFQTDRSPLKGKHQSR